MPQDPKLTPFVKTKLDMFEPKLIQSVKKGDYKSAKLYMEEIQNILRPRGYNSRLMKDKNFFFEAALEAGEVDIAIMGLTGVKNKVSKTSRIYLESIALLAVCYIRKNEIIVAQRYANETIKKINNIKSDKLRIEFHKSFLSRLDDEMILYNCQKDFTESINIDNVHTESIKLIQNNSEDEIFELIGNLIPEKTINTLHSFQKNNLQLLPSVDQKFLPQPITKEKRREVGKKFSSALKRVIWKGLCDKDSDLYQAWSQGLSIVHDKKYITLAVVTQLTNKKIGSVMLAASLVALAVRFGINIFCEMFEPATIMENRIK